MNEKEEEKQGLRLGVVPDIHFAVQHIAEETSIRNIISMLQIMSMLGGTGT